MPDPWAAASSSRSPRGGPTPTYTPGSSTPYLPRSFSPSHTPAGSSSFSSVGQPQSQQQPDPVTRSRTLFYLSIRDSSAAPRSRTRARVRPAQHYGDTVDVATEEEEVGLMGGGAAGQGARGLPPRWVDTSEEVEEVLGRVKGKIATLDKLHAKHVLPGFADRSAEEREIERQTSDITRDLRRCATLTSSLSPDRSAPAVERQTASNVQKGLAKKVQDLSGVFRKKQRVYMQKLQGHAIKNKDLLVASGAISIRGSEFDELAEDEQALQSQKQSQAQSQVQSAVNIDINQRTTEITQIASSISELAELFRDLGNLVVEQGTVLDSVEYNVQRTAVELEKGVGELKVAQRYQANTGRRKCILLLVLLIVGLIIILIYKPRGHSEPNQPDTTTPVVDPGEEMVDAGGPMETTPSVSDEWMGRSNRHTWGVAALRSAPDS